MISFRITIEPVKNWPSPPMARLRQLLKALLRAYGFKCITVEEKKEEPVHAHD